MITQEEITSLKNKYQTSEENIIREYFQHLFLSYFYQQPKTNKIFFKGGTALRLFYKSPRFSEDLDFSTNLSDKNEIETLLITVLEEIEKEGTPTDLQEATTTTGGYLANLMFQKNPPINIKLEISFRKEQKRGELFTSVNDFVPAYTVLMLTKELLVDGKIQALLTRRKPRDFYDLYFMLRADMLLPQKKSILPQVLEELRRTKINFGVELKQYLPKSHWMIIKDFKKTLEREINR